VRCGQRHVNLLTDSDVEQLSADGDRGQIVTEPLPGHAPDVHTWSRTTDFDEFVQLCGCGHAHLRLLTDPDSLSTAHRGACMGSAAVSEVAVDADLAMDCGELCGSYRVFLVQSGPTEFVHRGLSVTGRPGSAAVFAPEGPVAMRWDTGSKVSLFKFDRWAVEDALSDALGRQLTSQPDFVPTMRTDAAPTRSFLNMLGLFAQQLFHPDGLIHQPLVGMPFVDSLVRGFLLAAEHSQRNALMGRERSVTPHAIRTAVDVIEAEAHLPLTLSSIAARSQVSVRSLQQGFKRHLGMSPMSYLREVRLRRAHQTLIESDPSTVTVASVAYDWGFTNLGRFAAAHAARYREPPAKTLRRTA
jgi:AraC-like DNA-binding protein